MRGAHKSLSEKCSEEWRFRTLAIEGRDLCSTVEHYSYRHLCSTVEHNSLRRLVTASFYRNRM
jgi:hypothetical protein